MFFRKKELIQEEQANYDIPELIKQLQRIYDLSENTGHREK